MKNQSALIPEAPEPPATPLRKFATSPLLPLAAVGALLIMHYVSGAAACVCCAVLFQLQVAGRPEIFRTRSGSLKPALGLVAFLWLAAALVLLLTLTGKVRD